MDELAKISRVLEKKGVDAPHATILVLDGTVGQNAISQVKAFHEATPLSGLIVTKLDGSARGGIVVALAEQFGLSGSCGWCWRNKGRSSPLKRLILAKR